LTLPRFRLINATEVNFSLMSVLLEPEPASRAEVCTLVFLSAAVTVAATFRAEAAYPASAVGWGGFACG